MAQHLTFGDELKDAELGKLLTGLGMAVVTTNSEMAKLGDPTQPRLVVSKGTIKLNLALNIKETTEGGISGGLAIGAFNVNASYKSAYSYDQSGSCEILIEFAMTPPPPSTSP
jgi:hypothetical protein